MSFFVDPLYISAVSVLGARSLFHFVQSRALWDNHFNIGLVGGALDLGFAMTSFWWTESAVDPKQDGSLVELLTNFSPLVYFARVGVDFARNDDFTNKLVDASSTTALIALASVNVVQKGASPFFDNYHKRS
jgi:hypothetical protein